MLPPLSAFPQSLSLPLPGRFFLRALECPIGSQSHSGLGLVTCWTLVLLWSYGVTEGLPLEAIGEHKETVCVKLLIWLICKPVFLQCLNPIHIQDLRTCVNVIQRSPQSEASCLCLGGDSLHLTSTLTVTLDQGFFHLSTCSCPDVAESIGCS